MKNSGFDEEGERVVPDGMTIRRRRRQRGWSRKDLVGAIARANRRASGRAETISPNLLQAIEEENEATGYDVVVLISGGLDCNPVELLLPDPPPAPARPRSPDESLH